MLNYPKQMTLYKWFDELFGHFSGDVCFSLAFVLFALCANQKRGGLGQVRTTGVYHLKGHVEFSKFQTGNFW